MSKFWWYAMTTFTFVYLAIYALEGLGLLEGTYELRGLDLHLLLVAVYLLWRDVRRERR